MQSKLLFLSFLPSLFVPTASGKDKMSPDQEVLPLVLPPLPPIPLGGLACWENLFARVWKLDLRAAVLGSGTEASRSICRLMPHFPEHLFPQPAPCVVRILGKGFSYLLCDLWNRSSPWKILCPSLCIPGQFCPVFFYLCGQHSPVSILESTLSYWVSSMLINLWDLSPNLTDKTGKPPVA